MKVATAVELTTAINTAFAGIGHAGNTTMPRSKGNFEPLAWEFHVARGLKSAAETRFNKAHKACVANGMIFDHKKQPLPEGHHAVLYAGDVVELSVDVGTAGERFDAVGFREELEQKGVDPKLLAKLTLKYTLTNAAPHSFKSELVAK